MTATPSTMLPLGTPAPDFKLLDVVSNQPQSLQQLASPHATVIMFICNHCPFVKHIQPQLVKVARDYTQKGVNFVAINSNDVEHYPDDSPERMKEEASKHSYPFPYLFDESQSVAKAYQAACTPDFYVFDQNLKCIYRGQFDDSRPGNDTPVTGESLINALDCALAGKPLDTQQRPSIGCNIKWKP